MEGGGSVCAGPVLIGAGRPTYALASALPCALRLVFHFKKGGKGGRKERERAKQGELHDSGFLSKK